jgi:hypothetical protein
MKNPRKSAAYAYKSLGKRSPYVYPEGLGNATRSGTLTRQQRFSATLLCVALLAVRLALADAYDPPAGYYDAATGTGAVLKQQLHDIIDGHTVLSYDSARANLQITDADPNQPGHMLTVYDRFSLDVSTINPGGTIPGWDSGNTWNR